MRLIPESANRQDWPRLVKETVNALVVAVRGLSASRTRTGWVSYVHTGAAQTLTASTKVALVNNAGTIIDGQKPSDITALYNGTYITGRTGDSIGLGLELTFTPSDGTASNFYMAVDIGGAVGEIYPRDFPIFRGASVPHKISYNILAYTLDTWAANGGIVRVECDGPGSITAVRFVIHSLHRAR